MIRQMQIGGYHYAPPKSMKASLLLRRLRIAGKGYKQAWAPIIDGLCITLEERLQGDADYLAVSNIVAEYTDVPTIRSGLMKIVNKAYEVGL